MRKEMITLYEVAGYVTEKCVWQMWLDLGDLCTAERHNLTCREVVVEDDRFRLLTGKGDPRKPSGPFLPPEAFTEALKASPEQSGVWTLGALAFYAVTGLDVFEGRGGETQTADTQIPRIGSLHAGAPLSDRIRQCLSYDPAERPSWEELKAEAKEFLARPVLPRKRLSGGRNVPYVRSLVTFWPEEMAVLVGFILWLTASSAAWAQSPGSFDKSVITEEMATLVGHCQDLRSPQNVAKVSRSMNRDMSWTMMDELPVDKKGECTTRDAVDSFGLNDLGFGILKRHGGVTNAGGRFRDGRDPRYKYSFIEITVKQGASVSYAMDGREGEQLFAVVPYEKEAKFEAVMADATSCTEEGVCYIHLKRKLKKTDSFTLTIKNLSNKNMAYVLINYNSRNRE